MSIAGQLWRLLYQFYEHSFQGGRLITELYQFLYQTLSERNNSPTTTCKCMTESFLIQSVFGRIVIKVSCCEVWSVSVSNIQTQIETFNLKLFSKNT
jgi:hypothetical protein